MAHRIDRMLLRTAALAVLLALVGVAASAQQLTYNFMPRTNFTKYRTYKWVSIEGGAQSYQIVKAEIKQSIDLQLASKGLTKTDSDRADLYVGYQIAVDQQKQWNAYGMGGGLR